MNEIWELSKDLPRIPITEVKETTWERETPIETIIYNNNEKEINFIKLNIIISKKDRIF